MYEVKLDFPQVLGFVLKIIPSVEEVWIFYASAQFWQLHNIQHWHFKSTSPSSPSFKIQSLSTASRCWSSSIMSLYNTVPPLCPFKCCLANRANTSPFIGFYVIYMQASVIFPLTIDFGLLLLQIMKKFMDHLFFWSHKEIEASYQYLTNFQNYYNVLQLVEIVAWARYLHQTPSTLNKCKSKVI